MILSIISMLINTFYAIVSIMIVNSENPKSLYPLFSIPDTAAAINDQLIVVLSPILSSLLMLLCIPNYQKSLKRIILRQKVKEKTFIQTQNTMSISSKVSVTTKCVTHN